VENQVSFEDIKELFRETDRKMAESRAENDRRIAESRAEHDRVMANFDRRLDRLGQQIGGLGNRLERLGKFKTLFPEFASKRLLGAMAAMVISDDAAAYAGKMGLFVIGQKGEDAVLLNSEGFEPRAW